MYGDDAPKPFNEPAPTIGQEFIPPIGTVPQPMLMQAMSKAILKMLNDKGSTYVGSTNEKGLKHGKGKITYIDGSYYEGDFVDDKKEGHGRQLSKDGTIYDGKWHNDMREGEGTLYLPNGDSITSTFKNDRKHGKGHITTT